MLGEFLVRRPWILAIVVVTASLMAYLAYVAGSFDSIPFAYPLNDMATTVIKWVITPALICAGVLSLVLLLLIVGDTGDRP